MLYGKICAFQPIPGEPSSCFLSFASATSQYYALNAAVENYTFKRIQFPCEHTLFPLIAVAALGDHHRVSDILGYVRKKAGGSVSFDIFVQKSPKRREKLVFFSFWDPVAFKRILPDHTVQKIPGENFGTEINQDVLLYNYLPLYLDHNHLTMINSLVIEWDKFKKVDCAVVFGIFDALGIVKGYESGGENKVLVHYEEVHQSPLSTALTQQSLLGNTRLILSPNEGWTANVHVHIPRSTDHPIYENVLLPYIRRNSVSLFNVKPCLRKLDNINFASGLLNRCCTRSPRHPVPAIISATYCPEDERMDIVLEHAAHVDLVIHSVNRYRDQNSEKTLEHFKNIEAKPYEHFSNYDSSIISEPISQQ